MGSCPCQPLFVTKPRPPSFLRSAGDRLVDYSDSLCYNDSMKQVLLDILTKWNKEKEGRIKLQNAYFVSVFALAVISGLVTLISPSTGQTIIIIAAVFSAVYLINAISWIILEGAVINRLDSIKPKTKKQ